MFAAAGVWLDPSQHEMAHRLNEARQAEARLKEKRAAREAEKVLLTFAPVSLDTCTQAV